MARREGTLKISSNIEPRAAAPLDARTVVESLADLTASDSFSYPYIGLTVSVKSESKMYMLIGEDTTDINNWSPVVPENYIQNIDSNNDGNVTFTDQQGNTADLVVECTQEEYDSKPGTKYQDGIFYLVNDGDESEEVTRNYGISIYKDESDPDTKVTYTEDSVGMTPAKMGVNTFNIGSWGGVFFIPKPCMLKFDGTVDYYLDPSDYSKKLDGTPSDISNMDYQGNAMMEWPLIWYKFTPGQTIGDGKFNVSNRQIDETYKCRCNYDADGNIIPHFYTAIYNGTGTVKYVEVEEPENKNPSDEGWYVLENNKYVLSTDTEVLTDVTYYTKVVDNSKLRSLSGIQITPEHGNGNTTGTVEVTRATANNTTNKIEWYTDILSDYQLITMLLVLIGKSTNIQATFGRGLDTGSQAAKEAYITGTLNDKGLFWGNTSNGNNAVKVFGIENFYACAWHRVAGMVGIDYKYKVKLTHSTVDGSTAEGFNSTGDGYIDLGIDQPAKNGYIKSVQFTDYGFVPVETGGSSTTFYADYDYGGNGYLLMGGSAFIGVLSGPFSVLLSYGFGSSHWSFSVFLSCKPLARRG